MDKSDGFEQRRRTVVSAGSSPKAEYIQVNNNDNEFFLSLRKSEPFYG